MLAIWSVVPLPLWNLACTSGSFLFMYCWSLAWRIFSITLLACEMSTIMWSFQRPLALPFFGIGMKTDLFQSCGHCWVFQICWCIECSTLTASSFRILNSSAGISSPYYSAIKEKQNNAICSTVDGLRDCHTDWSKSEKDKYDIVYLWNLKKKQKTTESWWEKLKMIQTDQKIYWICGFWPLSTVGGNVNWCSLYRKHHGGSSKN